MERITRFDGEFWVHKNFPPVGEDTLDEFVDKEKREHDIQVAEEIEALGLSPDRLR